MRTILINRREIEAAIRAPQGRVYCVATNGMTCQIDQVRRKGGFTQVRCQRDTWISDILTIYREV